MPRSTSSFHDMGMEVAVAGVAVGRDYRVYFLAISSTFSKSAPMFAGGTVISSASAVRSLNVEKKSLLNLRNPPATAAYPQPVRQRTWHLADFGICSAWANKSSLLLLVRIIIR